MKRSKAEEKAIKLWSIFHQKDTPDEIIEITGKAAIWPKKWVCVGRVKTIYYNSDKWYDDGRRYNYYHLHNPKVRCWHPAGAKELSQLQQRVKGETFPVKGGFPRAITVLGDCLGWDLIVSEKGGSGLVSADPDEEEILCAIPGQHALVSLHPAKGVTAVIGGPGLRVEKRGIVG